MLDTGIHGARNIKRVVFAAYHFKLCAELLFVLSPPCDKIFTYMAVIVLMERTGIRGFQSLEGQRTDGQVEVKFAEILLS